jgi:phenylalanyl-tRNA synthetase alpha chain
VETQIESLRIEALSALAGASDVASLKEVRVNFLGKTGSISLLSEGMRHLSKEDRPKKIAVERKL